MAHLQMKYKAVIKSGNQGEGEGGEDTVLVIAPESSSVATPHTVTSPMSFYDLEKAYGDVDGFAEAAASVDTTPDWDAIIAELPTNTTNNTTLSNAIMELIDAVRG